MVILNKVINIKDINEIINHKHNIKELPNYPTINREGELQRFLRYFKNEGKIDKDIYNSVYP